LNRFRVHLLLSRTRQEISSFGERLFGSSNEVWMEDQRSILLRKVRAWLGIVVAGLIVSGLTAFPLLYELEILARLLGLPREADPASLTGLAHWLALVREGLRHAHAHYPFLAYGTDWLAYAHLIIAILFIGPMRDPVRNIWVIHFGMIACALVIPLALICGPIRGIPFYWQLIDCSFGVIGALPLWFALKHTKQIAALDNSTEQS
jgi:hypothetical protein